MRRATCGPATGACSTIRRGGAGQAIVRERIACRRVRVGPHDEVHLVPAPRQRMARLHRLDAVGPFERKPDVGEVEDSHVSAPSDGRRSSDRGGSARRAPAAAAAASRTHRTRSARSSSRCRFISPVPNSAMRATFHHTQSAIIAPSTGRQRVRARAAINAASPIVRRMVSATKRRWPNAPATVHDSTLPLT